MILTTEHTPYAYRLIPLCNMVESLPEELSDDRVGVPGNSGGDGASVSALTGKPWEWPVSLDEVSICAHNWWTESDFQTKLFLVLCFWLVTNLCLIWLCWRKYSDKLSQMLMKEESGIKEAFDGKIGFQSEDPLHYKYHSQTEKIHRD